MKAETRRLILTIVVALGGALATVYSDQKWALVAGSVATTLATVYGMRQARSKTSRKTDTPETPK